MEKKCLDCKQVLTGRSDKKFCCEACRISFHNNKMEKISTYTKMVLKVLRMNATILKEKIAKDHTLVDFLDLKIIGFNFSFFTYRYVNENGIEVFFCFEYGYYYTKENKIALVFLEDFALLE